MNKLTSMNRETFRKNLMISLGELLKYSQEEIATYKYVVNPVMEKNKKYNSNDDLIRLLNFSDKNVEGRYFEFEEIVDLFSGLSPLYPMWTDVSVCDKEQKEVELKHSLRFRKPSQIQNVNTGHPPFNIV